MIYLATERAPLGSRSSPLPRAYAHGATHRPSSLDRITLAPFDHIPIGAGDLLIGNDLTIGAWVRSCQKLPYLRVF